jgi:hypothetical protein
MRKPESVEIIAIVTPIFAAQAVVGIALFLGAAVLVQGHTLWAVIIGWTQ